MPHPSKRLNFKDQKLTSEEQWEDSLQEKNLALRESKKSSRDDSKSPYHSKQWFLFLLLLFTAACGGMFWAFFLRPSSSVALDEPPSLPPLRNESDPFVTPEESFPEMKNLSRLTEPLNETISSQISSSVMSSHFFKSPTSTQTPMPTPIPTPVPLSAELQNELVTACEHGNRQAAKEAMAQGAQITTFNPSGKHPVGAAIWSMNLELIQDLLAQQNKAEIMTWSEYQAHNRRHYQGSVFLLDEFAPLTFGQWRNAVKKASTTKSFDDAAKWAAFKYVHPGPADSDLLAGRKGSIWGGPGVIGPRNAVSAELQRLRDSIQRAVEDHALRPRMAFTR